MEQRPMAMNKSTMIGATERSRQRVQAWIDLARAVETDARHDERIARQECKACFYAPRLGGAAITLRGCMQCGQRVAYGSTNTDVLCLPCATVSELCKHCGGDNEMLTSRRHWPVAYSQQAGEPTPGGIALEPGGAVDDAQRTEQ
jgi:hypothetical protein